MNTAALIKQIQAVHGDRFTIVATEQEFEKEVSHFKVADSVLDAFGYGDDEDQCLALTKAYVELIERIAFSESGAATSNGFAAHTSRTEAIGNARRELLERDALLACWFAGRSPYWLSDLEIAEYILAPTQRRLSQLKTLGIQIKFGVCGLTLGTPIVVCAMDGRNHSEGAFGYSISSACDVALGDAMHRALLDQVRMLNAVRTRIKTRIHPAGREAPLLPEEVKTPVDHFNFFAHRANAPLLEWFLESSASILVLPEPNIEVFDISVSLDTAIPISVIQARSSDVQQFFVGAATHRELNIGRLVSINSGWLFDPARQIHPLP